MPRYCTVQIFITRYSETVEGRQLSEKTIYRWIDEGKLEAKKDPGGYGWLIKLDESTLLNLD